MISIDFSKSFQRALKRVIRNNKISEDDFFEKLDMFADNPFEPKLRTHKLSGKMKHLWAFSLGYDLRVVFIFEEEDKVLLIDIGTHDEVY
jgi:addiction module RelE/StbE family toxin